jgi:hypothetical protein
MLTHLMHWSVAYLLLLLLLLPHLSRRRVLLLLGQLLWLLKGMGVLYVLLLLLLALALKQADSAPCAVSECC